MMMDETLEELRKELARQDAELEAARQVLLEAPQNVALHVDDALLRDIEDACAPRVVSSQPFVVGVRV